jgi:hypothetical protein
MMSSLYQKTNAGGGSAEATLQVVLLSSPKTFFHELGYSR